MANGSAYDFGEAFGLLTCILEDAGGFASEGQSPQLDRAKRSQMVYEIDLCLLKAGRVLQEIKDALKT